MTESLKLLFLSTSVGQLGSGLGGGVELTVLNIAQELHRRGHKIAVVAPVGSVLESIRVKIGRASCRERVLMPV